MDTPQPSDDADASPRRQSQRPDGKHTGRDCLFPGRRVAVAMWDFSWLVRQTEPESEYADWGKVLDELIDRGYDCVRIDPSPHLLSEFAGVKPQTHYTILPQPHNFMWGNHTAVEVAPKDSLRRFLRAIKQRPLAIALSSWFLDDAAHYKYQIASPRDYASIWSQTLDLFAEEDMLDRVLWVDLCNEFPMSIWAPRPYQQIFRTKRTHGLTPSAMLLGRPWSRRVKDELHRYFEESIGPLRNRYPDLKYTFSFQEFGASNLRTLDLSAFDLIEAHIWLSDNFWWSTVSGHYKAAFGVFSDGARKHAIQANKIYPRYRERCKKWLVQQMTFWEQLAMEKSLPIVTSEGWASTFHNDAELGNDQDEWQWLKDLSEFAVEKAIEMNWSGICTSNFCQPHFPRFWADSDWHQRLTNMIKDVPRNV